LYNSTLKDYSKSNKMTLESLIDEANIEEGSKIREKDRTIKKKIRKIS